MTGPETLLMVAIVVVALVVVIRSLQQLSDEYLRDKDEDG